MSLDLTLTNLNLCECIKIELSGGITAYFTSNSTNLTFLAQTYSAIPIRRGPIQINTDLQTDRVDIGFGIIGITLGGAAYTCEEIVRYGFLRNAKVTIYLVDYTTPANYELFYIGWIRDEVGHTASGVSFSITSVTQLLQEKKIPAVVYSSECQWQIYDANCIAGNANMNPSNWDELGSADSGSTQRLLYDPIFAFAAHASGYWKWGKMAMTSGDNTGISRAIMQHYDGYVKVLLPFPRTIAVGAGFTAWPNCQGKGSLCHATFNNYANFLGFEYMPNPEALFC
jgi:uncharacterized phage protein (TIGR02218 family)